MKLLFAALLCAFCLIIQPARGQTPLAPKNAMLRETLPSGLRLLVAPRKNELVAIDVRVRVGSARETAATNGLSHFIEHLVFKGSASRKPGELDVAIETLGGELSARTSREATQFETVCPRENWRKVLALVAETVTAPPAFRPADVERERSVIARERRVAETEPLRQGFALLMGAAYPNASGEEAQGLPLMGSAENMTRFSPNDLRAFWETHYRADNMTLVVTGDVDAGEVAQAARDLFPAVSRPPLPADTVFVPAPIPSGVVRAPDPPAQTGRKLATILMGFRIAPPRENENAADTAPALDILSALLAGGPESRLTRALTEKRGIYTVRADFRPALRGSSLLLVAATGVAVNAATMEESIVGELERLREMPLTDADVETARRLIQSQRLYETETVQGWARQLAQDDLLARPDYDKQLALVSPEKVREAAARHLTAYRYTLAVVGGVKGQLTETPPAEGIVP